LLPVPVVFESHRYGSAGRAYSSVWVERSCLKAARCPVESAEPADEGPAAIGQVDDAATEAVRSGACSAPLSGTRSRVSAGDEVVEIVTSDPF